MLELLTQFPASNDEKYVYLWNMFENVIIWLTDHLSQTILWILVVIDLVWNLLESLIQMYTRSQKYKGYPTMWEISPKNANESSPNFIKYPSVIMIVLKVDVQTHWLSL